MKDYMGLYNERFRRQAPRFNNAFQARTYQDYIRNIQNQRAAAGQTFGGLTAQAQNQSFYDRAMGTPPGLSGAMQQQFANQMSAARARQLGQTAQQRYQAFADLSNQELQANQFARAEAASEQQFQTQNMAFKQQQKQYADQIMASGLSEEVKRAQLRDIGMTEGEIAAAGPQPGPAIMGGGATALVGIPSAIGIRNFARFEKNLRVTQELVGQSADALFEKTGNVYKVLDGKRLPSNPELKSFYDTANEKVKASLKRFTGRGAAQRKKDAIKAADRAVELFKEKQSAYVDDVLDGTLKLKKKGIFGKATKTVTEAAADAAANANPNLVLGGGIDEGVNALKDATKAGAKVVAKGKTQADMLAIKAGAKTKILGTQSLSVGLKAKGKALLTSLTTGFVGAAIAAYLVAEIGFQIATGTGLTKGLINLMNGKEFNDGTKGLIT